MKIEIQLVREPIAETILPPAMEPHGAWLEFRGVVRGEEDNRKIWALEYEAYPGMAEREIRRLLEDIAARHPCLAAKVIHRVGAIPAGETAIYAGIAATHRGEAIALLAEFMDKLKQDVPIWKRRALFVTSEDVRAAESETSARPIEKSVDEALGDIKSHCPPLPAVRAHLEECPGRILREAVHVTEDSPDMDRSTRDGYAILENDASKTFRVVDTLYAADWRPRELSNGEAVRLATGTALPCENLRVVMQENVERTLNTIRITRQDGARNIRKRGEEMKAGQLLLASGVRLDAGKLALLATTGKANPLASARLRVCHFTTGEEIVPPERTPKRGQIRDSNSILIRGLLEKFPCHLEAAHLPEDFERAKAEIGQRRPKIDHADVLLFSGGASVGEKDFTGRLLECLGFDIVFSRVNVRPGRPLIFGVKEGGDRVRIAFGLPGNPLSHFVGFHLFVAAALENLMGGKPRAFSRGVIASRLENEDNRRETFWPARLDAAGLHPLSWASSGDTTCLAEAGALIRVPQNVARLEAGAAVDFLPTNG